MWQSKKKGVTIEPGETKDLSLVIPKGILKGKEIGEIVLNYDDKYGNKYETRVLFSFKEKRIIRQDYNIIKKVKDIPEEDRPKLIIEEKDLDKFLKDIGK